MNHSRAGSLIVLVVIAVLFASSPRLFANNPASLQDVHKMLQQAAGINADTPPTPDQQKEMLGQAIKMLRTVPHAYHGQLKQAAREINAAMDELAGGDAAHKARTDILEADDLIKSVM